MTCPTASSALAELLTGLDNAIALAASVPDEQHTQPARELVDAVRQLAAQASRMAQLVASELPARHTDEQLAAMDQGFHQTTWPWTPAPSLAAEFDHPRTLWSHLITDLGDCVTLLLSGCNRDLRPRALCYEPLLVTLRADAQQIAVVVSRRSAH